MTNDLNDHFSVLLRSLLAEVLKTIETIGTIFFLACKQIQEGETDCTYCLYCLLKKTRGRKTTLLFCFLFSVSCVFYITGFFQLYWFFPIVFYILAFPNYIGFSQLYFIYWLFPIRLSFSNCLYSAPVNCPIKKMAPVARSFMM